MRLALPAALLAALLAGAAFVVRSLEPYKSGDDLGYNLGLAGGLMMLALLLYPVRKRAGFMRRAGHMKPWFQAHMALGILGPLLVLFHTGFKVGSVNAAVALTCMVVVSASGIIGRFAYRGIHHGLYGRKASLAEFEERLVKSSSGIAPLIKVSPVVERELEAYRRAALDHGGAWWRRAWTFVTLGLRARRVLRIAQAEVDRVVAEHGLARGRGEAEIRRRASKGRRLLRAYLGTMKRAGQFSAYERIFSLWHVLHIPLVWLLVGSAAYHVLAVHMY